MFIEELACMHVGNDNGLSFVYYMISTEEPSEVRDWTLVCFCVRFLQLQSEAMDRQTYNLYDKLIPSSGLFSKH